MLCTLIALAVACSAAPELPAQNALYDPNSGYADIVLLNSPVNPDGREAVCFDAKKYTMSDGQ